MALIVNNSIEVLVYKLKTSLELEDYLFECIIRNHHSRMNGGKYIVYKEHHKQLLRKQLNDLLHKHEELESLIAQHYLRQISPTTTSDERAKIMQEHRATLKSVYEIKPNWFNTVGTDLSYLYNVPPDNPSKPIAARMSVRTHLYMSYAYS